MKTSLILSLLLFGTIAFAETHAYDPHFISAARPPLASKCLKTAVNAIAHKGSHRYEKTKVISTSAASAPDGYQHYYIWVEVEPNNQSAFEQVCEIFLKSRNCSYEQSFGCASNLEELESLAF